MIRSVRVFLSTEAAGSALLLVATIVALAWANSAWHDAYFDLWERELQAGIGTVSIGLDLRHWVNEALMAVFFFVVSLEIKRELVQGELNELPKAALPVLAAVGGMLVPAIIYLSINAGGQSRGWGVPMATDIAFAVGLLMLLGERVRPGLKLFILTLAVVDDVGAIIVIALFYSAEIQISWLLSAGALVGVVWVLRRLKVTSSPLYLLVGVMVWIATFQSGIHATIAGVVLAFAVPVRSPSPGALSLGERLEGRLHPWTSFLVIPLFALANAGVELSRASFGEALSSRVSLGVILGLLVGKLVGISSFSWLAVKVRLGALPDGVSWPELYGAAAVAGIGFTVSLFIAGLAFDTPALLDITKVGIIFGSVLSALVGSSWLVFAQRKMRATARLD
ncbi:MAG: Na+/H+ antiporter NhaA [Actinobacteria bacterium]|nr:Na+/H+ antiporter NhaA [Actinomycetota bacterium]